MRVSTVLRHLVSQNKVRFSEGGFDLDLTYITDEIIAMGLPATGNEALYRNPIEEVVRFLELNHAGKYKVFNLCLERSYDISMFGDACACFPFADHGAPPLSLVRAFCTSAKAWLLQGLEHVVAIHCKAGKGRTGVMACCLLLHVGYESTASAAIALYNAKRTKDGKGLTVPSQRRYVRYYEKLLKTNYAALDHPKRTLCAVGVGGAPLRTANNRLLLVFQQHGGPQPFRPAVLTIDLTARESRRSVEEGHAGPSCAEPRAAAPVCLRCNVELQHDVRMDITDAYGDALARLWVHPALEPAEATFVLSFKKSESDMEVIDKARLSEGFTLTLYFAETEGTPAPGEPMQAGADGAPGAGDVNSEAPTVAASSDSARIIQGQNADATSPAQELAAFTALGIRDSTHVADSVYYDAEDAADDDEDAPADPQSLPIGSPASPAAATHLSEEEVVHA
ncbi:hypothetical protein AB1Y20_011185 [Prymnesium parvum]|uniref:Phosphatidylinositol-3,4,5-trisphosphate 3-phosphatase n=1 Tax=Prymnesium parvum TaxID=97485 RepID=A0AB34IM52_PRYPA